MSKLSLAGGPYVVGTLSSLDGNVPLAGDIVEVRLDKTSRPPDWLERCRAIEARGKPVLLTARLRSEGGAWPEDDEARLKIYEAGLAALAVMWIPLPYLLSPAESLTGPRQPLDGVLLTFAAFAIGCLVPLRAGARLRGNVPEVEE